MTNLDHLASDIADRVICSHCEHEVKHSLTRELLDAIFGKRQRLRRPNWRARDRFLAPHEKRLEAMLKGVWADERRVILRNMKRNPVRHYVKSDPSQIDFWLYPSTRYRALLTEGSGRALAMLMAAAIPRAINELGLDVSFELTNQRALDWLKTYTPKLSENLEAVNMFDLRRELLEGIEAGESMDKLRNRVNDVFESYNRSRAESIAKSETIRASNEGAICVAKEAELNQLIWMAWPGSCELCAALDGKVIGIDETFFDDDYGDGRSLRHPNCRCQITGYSEEWGA